MSSNVPDFFGRSNFPSLLPNFLNPWFDESQLRQQFPTSGGIWVYEEGNELHVEMPLPGLNAKDIDVNLRQGVLLVKGESSEETQDKNRKYYQSSRRSYSYSLALPIQIDENQELKANYNDGILSIALQKAKSGETKKITVKAGGNKK